MKLGNDSKDLMERLLVTLEQLKAAHQAKKPGRPRSTSRCDCGAMTAYRAAKRGHVCVATLDELYKRKEMK